MRRIGASALTWVALAISVALNVLQGTRILRLEDEAVATTGLSEGSLVPPLPARDLDGRPSVIEYGSSSVPTVLYVFSPSCRWCQANADSVGSLAGQIAHKYRTVGISLSRQGTAEVVSVVNKSSCPV